MIKLAVVLQTMAGAADGVTLDAGQKAWYIEPPFDLLANHWPCVIETVRCSSSVVAFTHPDTTLCFSGKRVALRFTADEMTPPELHDRELVVPTHSYGTRFCSRFDPQSTAVHSPTCDPCVSLVWWSGRVT